MYTFYYALSLEDNSAIFGTISILNSLSTQFNLPSDTKNTEHIPFDCVNGNFDISSARSHFELILSQRNHAETMKNREMQMRSSDKSVEQETEVDLRSASEFDEEDTGIESVTLENERRRFEKEEKNVWDSFNVLQQELLNLVSSNSDEAYISYINCTSTRSLRLLKIT